uniref:Uncharacterized protein n=1 Tax=viral metagenome TaxID=1070528 RepID=A0A6M3JWY0_9ZZZZ
MNHEMINLILLVICVILSLLNRNWAAVGGWLCATICQIRILNK